MATAARTCGGRMAHQAPNSRALRGGRGRKYGSGARSIQKRSPGVLGHPPIMAAIEVAAVEGPPARGRAAATQLSVGVRARGAVDPSLGPRAAHFQVQKWPLAGFARLWGYRLARDQ